jgi:CO/xanthine dehydrogenase FAD-binding subunit
VGRHAEGGAVIETSYFEPADLRQARSLLGKHPAASILAGGTDLVVGARSGKRGLPPEIVSIHRLDELRRIETTPRGGLKIGALTSHADIEASAEVMRSWSALADASALVGSPATRHLGTVGGNICNASPAMEIGSPLLVFDASVEVTSKGRGRRVPYGELVTAPGRTSLARGEMVTGVTLPRLPKRGSIGSAYLRLEYRQAMEIAVVGAAALIGVDKRGRCGLARIALTAVAPTCVRVAEAEAQLVGRRLDAESISRAAQTAAEAARPIDDVRASAEYRRAMVAVIVARAIARAHQRALSARA